MHHHAATAPSATGCHRVDKYFSYGLWIACAAVGFAIAVRHGLPPLAGKLCPTPALSSRVLFDFLCYCCWFYPQAATEAQPTGGSEDELADAQEAVQEAESSGKVSSQSTWGSLVEVAGLIFLAEWGDRSMLATIALGAAQNPVGVAVGATVGHAAATAIAVLGGALAGKYVSERSVNMASGVLFLLFAAATAYTMF